MSRVNRASATADGALVSRGCVVRGYWLTGDGTNAATAVFYNNSAASGEVLLSLATPAAGQTAYVEVPGDGTDAHVGVYVDVTTAGACRAGVFFQ